MSRHSLDRAAELFDQAYDLPRDQRKQFLDQHCGDDLHLRKEVEALLAADDTAGTFLSDPSFNPGEAAARIGGEGVGCRIGPYKLRELIGEGGFGRVFLAEQTRPVRRKVALKIVKLGMDTQQVIARFEAERQAVAMMDHPNIARVFDAGATSTGRPYFVMELVRGVPITRYCDQQSLSIRDRLRLFIPVCHAVQHAHQKGVIHRDLKPSNALITLIDGQPVPKIIDFGIAKATQQRLTDQTIYTGMQTMLGTPMYMSPEQATITSDDIDTRSDVYSLGVMLYELLTGSTPFDPRSLQNATYADVQKMIQELDPPRPSTKVWSSERDTVEKLAGARSSEPAELTSILRGELDWIVMRCLEKQRSRRYESVSALARDLEAFLTGRAVSAAPPSRAYLVRKFVTRHSLALAATAAVVMALAVALVVAVISLQRLQIEQARTLAEKTEADRRRAEAQTANETASAVNQFLNDMLASADPEMTRGKPITVEDLLDKSSATLSSRFADRPLVEAGVRETIGRTYIALAKYPAAAKNLGAALELRRSQGVADAPEFLLARAELAIALHNSGEFERSQTLFKQVVDQAAAQLATSDADTVPAIDVLARTASYIGVPNDQLEAMFRAATVRRRAILGADHADTVLCESMAAWYVALQERPAEAEPVLQRCLGDLRRLLGPADKLTLRLNDRVANLASALGRKDEALSISNEGLQAARNAYGFEHPITLQAASAYAEILTKARRYDEALALQLERLEGVRKVFGPDSTSEPSVVSSIARLYDAMGRTTEATEAYRSRIEVTRKAFGSDSLNAMFAETILAERLAKSGSQGEASQILARIMPRLRASLKPDSPRLAELVHVQMRALFDLDRKDEACVLASELLKYTDDQWDRANARQRLFLASQSASAAIVLARSRGSSSAEPAVRVALSRSEQVGAKDGQMTRELVAHLVDAAERGGRPDEAASLTTRLQTIDAAIAARAATQPAALPTPGGGGDDTPDAPAD